MGKNMEIDDNANLKEREVEAVRQEVDPPVPDEPDPPEEEIQEVEMESGENQDNNKTNENNKKAEKKHDKTDKTDETGENKDGASKRSSDVFKFDEERTFKHGGHKQAEMLETIKMLHDAIQNASAGYRELKEENAGMKKELKEVKENFKKELEAKDRKLNAMAQTIDTLDKRTKEMKIFLDESHDHADIIETMKVQVGDFGKELTRFNEQQTKFTESRLNEAAKELEAKFKNDFSVMKIVQQRVQEDEKELKALGKKVNKVSNIGVENQTEIKKAKMEARNASSQVHAATKQNAWKTQEAKNKTALNKIRQEQEKESKMAEKNKTHTVYVRVVDTEAGYDLSEIGSKIDKLHGEGTVKYCDRTRSGHIKIHLTKQEVVEDAHTWIEKINANFTVLDVGDWYKGVIYGVPNRYSVEKIRDKVESDNKVKLKMEPHILKESPAGKTVMLCFDKAEDYVKCSEGGVFINYEKFGMRLYRQRTREEILAYNKKKAQEIAKTTAENGTKAPESDSQPKESMATNNSSDSSNDH